MRKLRTFFALDSVDKLASIEAMALLLLTKMMVLRVPPRRWKDHFGAINAVESAAADIATVRRVRLAIQRALGNVPGSPNCLPQALTAHRMLKRRGIDARLYLGTMRDEAGALHFHAWLKVGEEWVTGLCNEDAYTLMLPDGTSNVWQDSTATLAP